MRKNKKRRDRRTNQLQRQHERDRNKKIENREFVNDSNDFPKLKELNQALKFIWNVECIKCRKVLYPVYTVPKNKIPSGYVYGGFHYDNNNICVVPKYFNKCGKYDKKNVEWTCFKCK